ncbi:efflux RND transporter periplasmic adaptor subunit [Marinobacter fonticola]|uniref:efflux RND transporter periplasmic adaptor subunit n=1 Tax=Marinobacter fonticola TaxID=2603215 RepID=UPI0011E7D085|nr:HlyD family efflux transporter periplasmic adaptor subunit [Marinobacter fonticola]
MPIILIILAVAVVAVLFMRKPAPPESTAEEKTWPIQTTVVESTARAPQLRLLGRIETPYQSTLSAAVTADVAALPVLEGHTVAEGEVIVELDDTEVKLLLDQRQADVDELQSQIRQEQNQFEADRRLLEREKSLVALAERALDRERRLEASNLNSQARIDQARQSLQAAEISLVNRELAVANHESRLQSLKARLARAQALQEQARLDLQRTEIRAPFAGVVTDLQASPGERVRPGEVLASLYATGNLEVRAQIPMQRIGVVQQALADEAVITATTLVDDQTYRLQLARLSGQVNPGAGGVDGLFRFTDDTPPAALNRTLDITLELPAQSNLFSVPVSALYDEQTLFRIADGRLEALQVTVVGDRFGEHGQRLLVRAKALKTGDRILTTQLPNAISGLKVTVTNPESDHG